MNLVHFGHHVMIQKFFKENMQPEADPKDQTVWPQLSKTLHLEPKLLHLLLFVSFKLILNIFLIVNMIND